MDYYPKLYKYRCFGENTDKIIINSSLWYAPPHSFNDPFDCQLSFKNNYSKKEIREYFIYLLNKHPKIKNKLRLKDVLNKYAKSKDFLKFAKKNAEETTSKIGILSLSKNYNNILMWSHYANHHKGLIFEFTPFNESGNLTLLPAIPIQYMDTHPPLLSYASTEKELEDDSEKQLIVKYIDWQYEEEYRAISPGFIGEREFPKKLLTSIFFGLAAKQSDIDNIIQLCKDHGFAHVKFKKAKKIPGKFALEFIDIT